MKKKQMVYVLLWKRQCTILCNLKYFDSHVCDSLKKKGAEYD